MPHCIQQNSKRSDAELWLVICFASTRLFHIACACRAWRVQIVEVKQERSRQEADQQRLAVQHHRQVLVRGLWEGLGQALALRRTAHQDAHRHYQLCRQRSVSSSVTSQLGSTPHPAMPCRRPCQRDANLPTRLCMMHNQSHVQRYVYTVIQTELYIDQAGKLL